MKETDVISLTQKALTVLQSVGPLRRNLEDLAKASEWFGTLRLEDVLWTAHTQADAVETAANALLELLIDADETNRRWHLKCPECQRDHLTSVHAIYWTVDGTAEGTCKCLHCGAEWVTVFIGDRKIVETGEDIDEV